MFTFRPLCDDDFELLTHWRNQPHNDAWWDGPADLDGIRERYGPRISPDHPARMFIVERDGKAFGRVQYEPTARWLSGFGPEVANVDYLIGDESDIGQGLGPKMVDQFVREVIFAGGRFTQVISDPEASNERSIRALEKVGFQHLEKREIDGKLFAILVRKMV